MNKTFSQFLCSEKRVSWQGVGRIAPVCRLSVVSACGASAEAGMNRLTKTVAATARKIVKHFIRCFNV